jgi:hypothetical protein
VLYQLSYFRDYFKTPCQGRFHFLLGQGRALPTELLPRIFQKHLAKVASISFWGKVVLYQLSYFREKNATSANRLFISQLQM